MELRNVRLELCTDEINPFRSFVTSYSCWQVILMVYNLPLEMCMRSEFMFFFTVIPSPNSPGQNINVCLRLLFGELKQLWSSRALTYDVSRKQNFIMKTTLMWTINDFPDYGMVSSWSMYEKLAYPYCMENNKAFTLTKQQLNIFFWLLPMILANRSQVQKEQEWFLCW
jgi:hypothetical protein